MSTMRIINVTNTCLLCRVVDLTCELRSVRQYRLEVPVCNICWAKEHRAPARQRARKGVHTRAREEARAQPT